MTKVIVCENDGWIESLEIKGHAGSAEYGSDLVCAGISTLTFGTLNALYELFEKDLDSKIEDGHINIWVKRHSEKLQLCLNFALIEYQMLTEQYPDNIEIIRKEV